MRRAIKIAVRGRVQGVGFRPFIYRLAREGQLTGTVQNNMDGVQIVWEGEQTSIETRLSEITRCQPRLARVDKVETEWTELSDYTTFSIIPSDPEGKSNLVIPIDAATCPKCLEEMRDPDNFRYRYPFINCTACGPRYTIIEGLPYDRPLTSMKSFKMCDRCQAEYEDPSNRRHHAQPIACPTCGPQVSLMAIDGTILAARDHAMHQAAAALSAGKIVAIKGIGGFHLACDAGNRTSVQELRRRKGRPHKPLAIMARSLAAVREIATLSAEEEEQLVSPEAPIVLLNKKGSGTGLIAEETAPGVRTIGVMLPYTPIHHLLFDDGSYDYLVMTSANPSGLPILYQNELACRYLAGIADLLLMHDRPILHPIDDSVVRISAFAPYFLRRARGYVPDPLNVGRAVDGIVALGSQMKNTFALGRHWQMIIGPHLGDLEAEESIAHYKKTLAHLLKWTGSEVHLIARDSHPQFATRELSELFGARVIDVQHHHAHLVSCMVDNGLSEPCLGIILDGTGYGEDGSIWGFEILHGSAAGYVRLAHLRETPLPGGSRSIREPWRNAAAMLIDLLGEEGFQLAEKLFPDQARNLPILRRMTENRINSPLAGTCGRLFDAVSAILDVCPIASYDGQAAIELSDLLETEQLEPAEKYPFELRMQAGMLQIDFSEMIRAITREHLQGAASAEIIRRFHETVADACCTAVCRLTEDRADLGKKIVLSGGSMNNDFLASRLIQILGHRGFAVYTHHRFPSGDGGLCAGQLMIAAAKTGE
ncbi:MAG: carbamoyltransferase HypF [Sporolactobacillus sp.]